MIVYDGKEMPLITFGGKTISQIYQGSMLLYQKALPTGTILFEKYGTNGGGGGTKYELILPTAQMIEIVIVGGGSPVVGAAIDL